MKPKTQCRALMTTGKERYHIRPILQLVEPAQSLGFVTVSYRLAEISFTYQM